MAVATDLGPQSRLSSDPIEGLKDPQPNTDVLKNAALEQLSGSQRTSKFSEHVQSLTKGHSGNADAYAGAAETLFRRSISKGISDPMGVVKGLSPLFGSGLGRVMQNPQSIMFANALKELTTQVEALVGKTISLTSPLTSGLVPFDLEAPTKLIYPVFSPLRNLIPRTPGHGVKHQAKVMTSILGSNPGGLANPAQRFSIPELPSGGSLTGANWPNQLPSNGSQSGTDVAIPYRFFGLTEALTWLAQFSGAGFEDIAGLMSLILLQEFMIGEEKALIGATSVALATPGAPGVVARTPNSGETAVSGYTTNVYVVVTAQNYYGETVQSAATTWVAAASKVLDVTISPVGGALNYNIYAGTGASDPGRTGHFRWASNVGAATYTLQGAVPASGAVPPAADTGTSASTDYEGLISTISGHSAGTIYPAGYQGSYVNSSVGQVLGLSAINTALEGMWNGANGIFADPDEIWGEGSDIAQLGSSILAAGQGAGGYRINFDAGQSQSLRLGGAVTEFVNPVTRKILNLRVHPYFSQGTAAILSWKLPIPWGNVSNVWENVMVQDYLSISWPVIDVTYRYSMFMYGALFSPAVQYNGLLQGLQRSVATASSGTNA